MSIVTICNQRALGIHVVEVDAAEQAMRSSWEGEYAFEGAEELEGSREEVEELPVSRKQLTLIYSLQLAEAYVEPSAANSDCTDPTAGLSRQACSRSSMRC